MNVFRSFGPTVHLTLARRATIAWHSDRKWHAYPLLADGTLVSRCAKDLAFLQLHHGNRRVTLDEAGVLLGV